jgi:hypothetical protein
MLRLSVSARYALIGGLAATSLALALWVDGGIRASAVSAPAAALPPLDPQLAPAAEVPDAARHWREPSAPEPLQLAGVVVGEGAQRLALVSLAGMSSLWVRPGDMVAGGYQVVAIDQDSLTYRWGEREVRVGLHEEPRHAAAALPQPAAPVSPVAATAGPADPGAATSGNGNEAFRQAVEQRLASMRR